MDNENNYRCLTCGNFYPKHYMMCPECFETQIPSILRQLPAPTKRLQEFDKEVASITQRRGETYGPPSIDFERVARLKSVVAECNDPLVRHVLEILCVKISRLIQTPSHLDSWVDIAGYARCGVMVSEPKPVALVDNGKKDCADQTQPGGTGARDCSIERLDPRRMSDHEHFIVCQALNLRTGMRCQFRYHDVLAACPDCGAPNLNHLTVGGQVHMHRQKTGTGRGT